MNSLANTQPKALDALERLDLAQQVVTFVLERYPATGFRGQEEALLIAVAAMSSMSNLVAALASD